ncbi:MAG TPA: archaellin/type IV pilin N-terminal domain-containing protein [Candidatus Nanoarchaeia archaeon]|nr:archaellin/type IV pilin N-terminal domain-containing protein [Candidatus Nanoarchaeia archaeon]
MNTKLRKMKNNAKALSPVVASIILIAVTVAVSVAVAAWMGGMTLGFMQTEQVKVDNPAFDTSAAQTVTVDVTNSGTQAVVLNKVQINGVDVTTASDLAAPYTLKANTLLTITITKPSVTLDAGSNYQITVITSKGNQFSYSAVAPQ